MSVICKCASGFVIDHNLGVSKALKGTVVEKTEDTTSIKNAHFRGELFQINEPFLMDSQYTAMQNKAKGEKGDKSKKRRRATVSEIGEDSFLEFHKLISDKILSAYRILIHLARQEKYFDSDTKSEISSQSSSQLSLEGCSVEENECNSNSCAKQAKQLTSLSSSGEGYDIDQGNNKKARDTATKLQGPGESLCNLCHEKREMAGRSPRHKLKLLTGMMGWDIDPVNQCYSNDSDHPAAFHFYGSRYIIPGNSTFLLTDFYNIETLTLIDDFKPFDCIVIDPPWVNKSVKRKKMYKTLANEDFIKIPISSLASDKALIVVWVTNKMKHVDFVKEELFPAWNVQYVTEWFWLKVTTRGEMVYDINSDHKKPYELMIIGRHENSDSKSVSSDLCCMDLPVNQTVISVPCALHSMKPPLNDVLKAYLRKNAQCLELFARNLWPGWTSCGNEVLLHQHTDFYKFENT